MKISLKNKSHINSVFSFFTKLLLIYLFNPIVSVHALPDDREQPIHISSNSATRDEKTGITVYSGQVTLDQGTLHLTAEKLIIKTTEGEVAEIVAEGNPAKYQQQPQINEPEVYAEGKKIIYQVAQEELFIKNQASLKRQGSLITSNEIHYNVSTAIARAIGNDSNSSEPSSSRVNVVLPPLKPKNSNTDPSSNN